MNRVIAAIDTSLTARPVLGMAMALAPLLGASVEAVHVGADGDTARKEAEALDVAFSEVPGDPVAVLLGYLSSEDVVAVVIGARNRPGGLRELGHVALELADAADKPVLVVPPETIPPAVVRRVLAAVKGTPDRARPLRRAIAVLGGIDLELVVVHVENQNSIPAFSDQPQYEVAAYAAEFLARHVPGAPLARVQLRFGDAAKEILTAADEVNADVLAVGWTQSHDADRGRVVRALVATSPVPTLLVPLA